MVTVPRSVSERRVFVDSSAYLALVDRRDEHHDEAVAIVRDLGRQRCHHVTTSVILVEAHALILSVLGQQEALRFMRGLRSGNTQVARVREDDESRAERILERYADKDFSLADAISFAVMERLDIRQAFTFDRHFAQFGWIVLTPDLRRSS